MKFDFSVWFEVTGNEEKEEAKRSEGVALAVIDKELAEKEDEEVEGEEVDKEEEVARLPNEIELIELMLLATNNPIVIINRCNQNLLRGM